MTRTTTGKKQPKKCSRFLETNPFQFKINFLPNFDDDDEDQRRLYFGREIV